MTTKVNHDGPHKYFKGIFKSSGTLIFRCGFGGCPHFLYEPMILGRYCICWRCGTAFIIVEKTLRCKKLHCIGCSRGRYNKVKDKVVVVGDILMEEAIDNILNSVGEPKEKKKELKEGDSE